MRYLVEDYDYTKLQQIPILENSQKKNAKTLAEFIGLKDVVCAFDIETTRIPNTDQSIMYIWQFQIGLYDTIIGRTWKEFKHHIQRMIDNLDGAKIVVYVHNLSFEFQFLRGIYNFKKEDVFCVKSRKVIRAVMCEQIEFRCSYIHSNMSLAEYTTKFNVEHRKLSGEEFNYNKIRYPWTIMTEKELDYCCNDVQGLVEAITEEMRIDGDNLVSIPLTSTGYVRRDTKHALLQYGRNKILPLMPNESIYTMCREAFRGGNTHANRFYAGVILENVHSYDRSSSYPDVQCNCEFPVTPFFEITNPDDLTFDNFIDLIERRGKAVFARVSLENVRLQDKYWGCPYLSRDKCRNTEDGVYDNGRILEASYLETTITDVDFKIIMGEYEWDNITILSLAHSTYGKLPRPLIDNIISYYHKKTSLKGVEGQEIYYMKSKNKLNSIYGMSAQDPAKQLIEYIDGEYVESNKEIVKLLAEFNRHGVQPYYWGVWTTAWARYRLEEGIIMAGDGFVYCDTDSVKYVGEVDWTAYNEQRMLDSIESGANAIDKHGLEHYMGVYEEEATYRRFKTLGSKKYAYTYSGDSIVHITIAGVSKRKGAVELTNRGGLKAFKPGFIFYEGGGLESVYNDLKDPIKMNVEGHEIWITSNVTLKPSTYELGITGEYKKLLDRCRSLQ